MNTFTVKILWQAERPTDQEPSMYELMYGRQPAKMELQNGSTDIDIRECPESSNFAGVQSLCKAVLDWKGTIPGLRHDAGNSWLKYTVLLDMAAQATRATAR